MCFCKNIATCSPRHSECQQLQFTLSGMGQRIEGFCLRCMDQFQRTHYTDGSAALQQIEGVKSRLPLDKIPIMVSHACRRMNGPRDSERIEAPTIHRRQVKIKDVAEYQGALQL
jgi:hypothetical protein